MSAYSIFIDTLTPVGYWPCSEASGDLIDASGNVNDMAAQGTATYGVPGAINTSDKAIRLDGANANYFSNAGSATLGSLDDTFSVMAWFKKAENGRRMAILDCVNDGFIFEMSVGNTLQCGKQNVGFIAASNITITDFGWHFGAWTKSTTTTVLYLDGRVVTGSVSDQVCALADTGAVNIGRCTGFNSLNWNGDLAHIMATAEFLSAASINRAYQLGRRMFDNRRRRR